MTEAKWLAHDYPMGMVHYLGAGASERKLNFLAASCFRRIWHLLPGPRCQRAVELIELAAEIGEREEMRGAVRRIWNIFDNPFRPVTFSPFVAHFDTAAALARQMYDSRDFGAMPVLADAPQDAGCDSDDTLATAGAMGRARAWVSGCGFSSGKE